MMKKNIFIISIALGFVLCMGACKSKTSAYRQAYEKAKEKDVTESTSTTASVYQPSEVIPYTPSTTTTAEKTQTEKVTVVQGENANYLKKYSVVIYSFKNKTNATAVKDEMVRQGYEVVLALNENNMYRVIIASYDDKASAVVKKNEIKAKYAPRFDDIWILERL